ncbi:hypothetical protein G3O08_02390 [Cryomorpha ignava]|uniref:Uncharacterized protein n=1 Tax=Cryomorpha ignava TaxID=101383 RepID=A0A7K3WL38_9FLAO|nr:hypothetical protein [Cryomorpha ignava]NEN22349.1 hypothetical protein [Cryomorpha ignava]
MKIITLILSIGFLLLLSNALKAQYKYEREYRIKSEMIPQSAQAFIDSIGPDSRIKWYKEISLDAVSIEAKFKHNKKKFSVEFDTLGILQDVEFIIESSEIPPVVFNKIEQKLDSLYEKWKFQKIQIHYSGSHSDILTSIHKNEPGNAVKVYFEIVLKGKNPGNTQEYEITFNAQGEMQHIQMIIQDEADHLEY